MSRSFTCTAELGLVETRGASATILAQASSAAPAADLLHRLVLRRLRARRARAYQAPQKMASRDKMWCEVRTYEACHVKARAGGSGVLGALTEEHARAFSDTRVKP